MAGAFQSITDVPDYVLKAKAYQHNYYLKHQEKKINYQRIWWTQNKERVNARRRKPPEQLTNIKRGISYTTKQEYNKRYYLEVEAEERLRNKIKVLQIVSKQTIPICERCGEQNILSLTINHLNGGGREEFAKVGSYDLFIQKIISGERATDDLNVLCLNHNIEYEYIRGRRRLPRNWLKVYKELTEDGGSIPV